MGTTAVRLRRQCYGVDWMRLGASAFVVVLALGAILWLWMAKHHLAKAEASAEASAGNEASLGKRMDVLPFDAHRPRTVKGKGEELFLSAMSLYSRGNYAGAASALREAELADPEAAEIHLYLGYCFLMTGDTAAGTHELKLAVGISGPYAEDSRFYLAKGYLLGGDSANARLELEQVAHGNGSHARAAAALLSDIATPLVVPGESSEMTGGH